MQGQLGFIDEAMAVFRVHEGGVWSRLGALDQAEARLALYERLVQELGKEYTPLTTRHLYRQRYELSVLHWRARNDQQARYYARQCFQTAPAVEHWKTNARLLFRTSFPGFTNLLRRAKWTLRGQTA